MASSDFEVEIKEVLDEEAKIRNWNTDDMIKLLTECEIALSNNEGRIEKLKAKGLEKLYYIITGVNKRNKIKIQETVHAIQDISFRIQKILLERIDIVASAVVYLNDKVNARMNWSNDIMKKLIRKIESLSNTQNLLRWQTNVRSLTTSNGKKYIDVSDGHKILLVVSDLFGFAKDWKGLIDRPLLETTLDNLRVDELIKASDFYGNLIHEKESLSLYVKENYDYRTVDISSYGQMIYEIAEFYSQPHLTEVGVSLNKSIEDMCREYLNTKWNDAFCEIDSVDLCDGLINDLVCLESAFRKEQAEKQRIKEAEKHRIEESKRQKEKNKGGRETTMTQQTNYSIFKITPEGLWLFKEKKVSYNEFTHDPKANYSFSKKNDEEIQQRLGTGDPYMVAMPEEYYEQCMSEEKNACRTQIKNILRGREYISLADYYMYLWFYDMNPSERKNKKLAFIEFYDNDLYVSGYAVDESGDGYRKGFSGLKIHKTKSEENIKKLIKAEGVFSGINWENILCFQVFTTDKSIGKKLINMGVSKVVGAWEKILETDNDTLGNIIQNMLDKR